MSENYLSSISFFLTEKGKEMSKKELQDIVSSAKGLGDLIEIENDKIYIPLALELGGTDTTIIIIYTALSKVGAIKKNRGN